MKTPRLITCSALIVMLAAGALRAGPLNPPAGPVTSTMKTLTEVEPRIAINMTNTPGDNDATPSVFKITQPGSYYMTGNFTVPADFDGIEIAAESVTIDLNGFVITGATNSNSGIGVHFNSANARNIVIRNGTIDSVGGAGIALRLSNAPAPQTSLIENVIVRNTYLGIDIQDGIVRGCEATENQFAGISVNGAATIVESCVTRNNTNYGIFVVNGTVTRCSSSDDGTGITCNTGLVKECAVSGAVRGIAVGDASVADCTVKNVSEIGIYKTGGRAFIRGNSVHCASPTSTYGLFITGTAVRVEANNISAANKAIYVGNSNNLIISNSFDSCVTAVHCQPGNRVGPIVFGTSSPAINGNSGGGLGTTDPYANVIY